LAWCRNSIFVNAAATSFYCWIVVVSWSKVQQFICQFYYMVIAVSSIYSLNMTDSLLSQRFFLKTTKTTLNPWH